MGCRVQLPGAVAGVDGNANCETPGRIGSTTFDSIGNLTLDRQLDIRQST